MILFISESQPGKKLFDSFKGGMDIELGNSRRDGLMIDFQLMILSEIRKTRRDIASVTHKVRVIEIQVQMIENLLGENHSRTRYIMFSTLGMAVLQSVYIILVVLIKVRNWSQVTSQEWKEFQDYRTRSSDRNTGSASYILYPNQRHRVNNQIPRIESGD